MKKRTTNSPRKSKIPPENEKKLLNQIEFHLGKVKMFAEYGN